MMMAAWLLSWAGVPAVAADPEESLRRRIAAANVQRSAMERLGVDAICFDIDARRRGVVLPAPRPDQDLAVEVGARHAEDDVHGAGRGSGAAAPSAAPDPEPAILRPVLSRRNEERVIAHLDHTQVSLFLSDLGPWPRDVEDEELQAAARFVLRRVVRTQLELLQPKAYVLWRESGISLRSGARYAGERRLEPGGQPTVDVDVGLTSGKPFLAATVARARITLDRDILRGETVLTAKRRFGRSSVRLELRRGTDPREDEYRFGLSIPLPRS